jgi:hypothetical protein
MLSDIANNAAQDDGSASADKKVIYCDCDGTLFTTKDGQAANKLLFQYLKHMKDAGHTVIIFSAMSGTNAGNVQMQSMLFFGKDNANIFEHDGLIVTHKDGVIGEKAWMVIDDNHDTHKVDATYKVDPMDLKFVAYIKGVVEGQNPVLTPAFTPAP